MIVDGSYMAWVRPTRRVHLALSVGMTVTGILLAAMGMCGDQHAVRPSAPLGRSADSVVGGGHRDGSGNGSGTPAGPVLPALFVRFAPPAPGKVSARPRPKPGAARAEPAVRAPVPARAPAPIPVPAAHDAPHPMEVSHPVAPAPPRSPERLPEQPPAHRLKH